jgi:inorganic triphosphatase YgiF
MTGQDVPAEVEIKLEAASTDALRHVAQLRVLGRFRMRPRRVQHLHSVYFDTKDFALVRAGIALRVRRNGRAWEATAKWGGRVAGALHERPELTVALPGEPAHPFTVPDGPLRTHLGAVLLGRRLGCVLISDVRRELRDLFASENATEPLAEIALDSVELRAPDGALATARYYEIEIERRAGKRRDLVTFAQLLQQRFGLVPSRASKFGRGLSEVYGDAAPLRGPQDIQAADTLAAATRRIVAAQLARLRAADPGTRAGDAEALHEARVAVRRLRAATRTFAAGFPARLREKLIDELRWLGHELGAVRDLDVQLVNLDWHADHLPRRARQHLKPFRVQLDAERAVRRAALITGLDSRRYIDLLRSLEAFASSPAPRHPRGDAAQPVAAVGRRAIKRTMRKLMDRGDAIGEVPEAEELHALRIRGKRLRYMLEALKPISVSPGKKLIRQLVRLQDVLGRFNDAMVAATFIRAYLDGPASNAEADERRTLSTLADQELRRAGAAQSDFARAWRRFTAKSTLRELRALLKQLKAAARLCTVDADGTPGQDVRQVAES